MRGIGRRGIRRIYDELETRVEFLTKLIDQNVLDYYDVWRAVKYAYNVGVEAALGDLQKGGRQWLSTED